MGYSCQMATPIDGTRNYKSEVKLGDNPPGVSDVRVSESKCQYADLENQNMQSATRQPVARSCGLTVGISPRDVIRRPRSGCQRRKLRWHEKHLRSFSSPDLRSTQNWERSCGNL